MPVALYAVTIPSDDPHEAMPRLAVGPAGDGPEEYFPAMLGVTQYQSLLDPRGPAAGVAALLEQPRAPLPQGWDPSPLVFGSEVWAAGVTYLRSKSARMEESESAADVYDLVYDAERPELFWKAHPHDVRGHRQSVGIRADSTWNVPEPELALALDGAGRIVGYTVGNDMSSRSIEGDNPLYLPQAKVYDGSCAVGPGIVPASAVEPPFDIRMLIERDGADVFAGETSTSQMKRTFEDLAAYLVKARTFRAGATLLTGTGIVPPNDFTLQAGDIVRIEIGGLGRLTNVVEVVGRP